MSKIIWLQGGFGNVLFQLIPALHLSYKFRGDKNNRVFISRFLTNESFMTIFLRWKIHEDEHESFLSKSKIQINEIRVNKINAIKHIFLGFLSKKLNKPFLRHLYFNKNFHFNQIYSSNHYFGYFQDKLFLQNHEKELKKIFSELRIVYNNNSNKVECAVHFRYGDSVWARQNGEYYKTVKDRLKEKDCLITIVTDSKKEANLFFEELPNFKIISQTVEQDFSILLSAKILYTAPSTFSWWAGNASLSDEIYMPEYLQSKLGFFNSKIQAL